jgi:peptidoglycan hydrolase-like protein with peptidoglycan-binding domain
MKNIIFIAFLFLSSATFAEAQQVAASSDYYVAPGVKRVKTSVTVVLPKERVLSLSETVLLKDLAFGATGQDVRYVQEFLADQGYKVKVSGIFGRKTRLALRNFQEAHKAEILDPMGMTRGSGDLDSPTRSLINRMLKK